MSIDKLEQKRCPFADPAFTMDPNVPCPVCGDLGTFPGLNDDDDDAKCVDLGKDFL